MQCRICFETDHPEDMVSPCRCSGSIQYIHKTCLYAEQRYRREEWERTGIIRCTICREPYVIRPEQPGCNLIPEIIMSSFIQLCILLMAFVQQDLDPTYKLSVVLFTIWNVIMIFVWARIPFRYSAVQHGLIHTTTGVFLLKQAFPSYPWNLLPYVLIGLISFCYNLFIFYITIRQNLDIFPVQCMAALLTVEYILITVAFHQTVLDIGASLMFIMSFTNICLWGHGAMRVYHRNA